MEETDREAPMSVRPSAVFLLLPLCAAPAGAAQEPAAAPPRRAYEATRARTAPKLDGRIDDPAWQDAAWTGDFVQREPKEGVPPTAQTQFKVLYDDEALYFAFRAFDDPRRLTRLLSRRDRFPGDWVEVNIDSYADRRTGFSFTLSLSGTRGDEFISQDGNRWDPNWDPVWEGATSADGEGWTAEMRIPLSQLRFSGAAEQTWGLQVQRRIFRQEERSTWQVIPKSSTGWVSNFGELRGIRGLKPRPRRELLPYAVARGERFEEEPGNPFRDGGAAGTSLGLDGKLGITSNLTADFTLNPDFGQVEADPSEVNLTAYETFFEEKRPFFIEGNDIFEVPLANVIPGSHFTRDRLFYSRRIGVAPPHSPDVGAGEFAFEPANSSILGAMKLTGKTGGGLSVGVLESVTAREQAEIDFRGFRRRETTAPLANFFVGRAQQDLRGGDTFVGLIVTSVDRRIDEPQLEFLPAHAVAAGADFSHYFRGRAWRLEANAAVSHLRGRAEAIAEAQTSSARYFQRPDNDHADFDPTRTSLGGHGGSVRIRRTGENRNLSFQTGGAWRSPGFEINDLGFMNRADELNQFGWVGYQFRNPFSIFRRVELNANEWLDWDFGGAPLRRAVNTNGHAHFKNNWQSGFSITRDGERVSNAELRGGPSTLLPGRWTYDVYVNSDQRRRVYFGTGTYGFTGDEGSGGSRTYWMDMTWRPTNALTLTLSPNVTRNEPEMQYVDTVPFAGGERYLFGRLDQDTKALTVRLDFAITPNLTVQYYGAPFASRGRYSQLKRVTDPRADAYRSRFRVFDPGAVRATADGLALDEDGDGAADYTIGDPDFDVRELNSTLVARWEYRPGSLVYLVWSQARDDDALLEGRDLPFARGLGQAFDAPAHHVFLLKFSKWFAL
jgi:hypothetical protein